MGIRTTPATNSLFRTAWRYLVHRPLQSTLMILGIALGVAVAVSVDVANASAERAFQLSTEAVAGRSTHYISGGPGGLPEEIYVQLRLDGLDMPMAPVISHIVSSPQIENLPLQLLGIDPFAEAPFRSYFSSDARQVSLEMLAAFYAQPGAVIISSNLAERYQLQVGDPIELKLNGKTHLALVVGLIKAQDALSARALENLLLADISTVQEISGREGKLERIDLILPDENTAALLEELNSRLPEEAVLLKVEGRSEAVEQMTAAFRTNLTALSLLGLLVGLFLIYNTMTFSVVQRRASFGTLRALGVTSQEIFALVLSEALAVGIIGSILGILLGVLLGRGAVSLVSQTINDVFFTLTVREVGLPMQSLIKGSLLGILATLVAAAFPAWEAAKAPPRKALSRERVESLSKRLAGWAAFIGLGLTGASALMLASTKPGLTASFALTFGVVIGFALTAPWINIRLMPSIAGLLERVIGPIGRLAPREVSSSASRTSVAMAALMVAVAVTIGVSLMVNSFRSSVINWLDQILSNDIYLSVAGASLSEPMVALDEDLLKRVRNWDGVAEVHLLRNVQVDSPYGPIMVSANNNPNDGEEQLYVAAEGSGQEVWQAVQAGAVMLSEPLANRLNLSLGDIITLYTDNGPRDFAVAAIFRDYTSSQGNVSMWLPNYQSLWQDWSITAISLGLTEGKDVDAVVAELRSTLNDYQQVNVRSNKGLREETLEVFDRTFAITRALQVITTGVAFVGVLSAMLSLQLEKQRQLGILKAIGLSTRQTWSLVLTETGLIGAIAGLLALPTGYAVAVILVHVINQRSFGWTLQMHLEAAPFAQALLIAIGAALLAGLYPAYRMSHRQAADAIRFD